MDFLFELIFELLFEGSTEIAKNRKISKWIRYPIIVFILLFFIPIFGLIGIVGIMMLVKHSQITDIYLGIFLVVIDFILIGLAIRKAKKQLRTRNDEKVENEDK